MKLLVMLAVVIGGAALFGTRRDTPFLRWGIIVALLGVLLVSTAAIFTARGVLFGGILFVLGAAVYYYGRFVRREQLLVPRSK
ncbi:MAG: hypothetical protein ABR508_08275 [Candidatus Baltobacteraceae bacterium]